MRRPLLIALLAAAGCIDDLEPQYLVKDLRILAVRAEVEGTDWADARPGDTLRLAALVANPLGRPLPSVAFYACPPELFPSCPVAEDLRDDAALAARLVPLGAGTCAPSGASATCALSLPVPPATGEELALLEETVRAEPTWRCRLYAELPVVAVAASEGRREVAVKRVRLTPDPATLSDPSLAEDYARNAHPAISALYASPSEDACPAPGAGGLPPEPLGASTFPPARTFLCGGIAAGAQPYYVCDASGARDPPEGLAESLSWQWYVTGGEFPEVDGRGNATGVAPEFERPAEAFTLWTILRDGRGGESWATLAVDARAP